MFLIQRARIAAAIAEGRLSVLSLLLVNLLPLVGVFLLGWSAFDVVFLYWCENVVIGAVNVLKILTSRPDQRAIDAEWLARLANGDRTPMGEIAPPDAASMKWQKMFLAPFFAVHYGGFCAGHGMFICMLLGVNWTAGPSLAGSGPFEPGLAALSRPGIQLTVLALLASHLVSFFAEYLGRGEYRQTTPMSLMMRPYGRIILLHVAIIASGFLVVLLGSPVWLLVLLVVGKTVYDLVLHLREHERTTLDSADLSAIASLAEQRQL